MTTLIINKSLMFLSSVFYFLIDSILVSKYGKVNKKYILRGISTYHATVVCLIIGFYWYNLLSTETMSNYMLLNSFGYFFMDSYKHYPCKNTEDVVFILHHILSIVGLIYIKENANIMTQIFFTEFTTPFLNISWLYTKKKFNQYLFIINGIFLIVSFFLIRVYNLWLCGWEVIYNDVFYPKYMLNIAKVFSVIIIIMNVIWFIKVLIVSTKKIK